MAPRTQRREQRCLSYSAVPPSPGSGFLGLDGGMGRQEASRHG